MHIYIANYSYIYIYIYTISKESYGKHSWFDHRTASFRPVTLRDSSRRGGEDPPGQETNYARLRCRNLGLKILWGDYGKL